MLGAFAPLLDLRLTLIRRTGKVEVSHINVDLFDDQPRHGLDAPDDIVPHRVSDLRNVLTIIHAHAKIHGGLDQYRKARPKLLAPYRLGRAVAAFLEAGEIEGGMALLIEAIRAMEAGGERWYEAELFRFKGLLLLASSTDAQAEAEACFRHAMDVARAQGARLFELRAAVALGQQPCEAEERRRRKTKLAAVLAGFAEDLDTPDIREASALIEVLD